MQAAPALDRATAEYQAADWDCRQAAAQRASAVPQAAPRRAAREVRAARLNLVAPALAEDRGAESAGPFEHLVLACC